MAHWADDLAIAKEQTPVAREKNPLRDRTAKNLASSSAAPTLYSDELDAFNGDEDVEPDELVRLLKHLGVVLSKGAAAADPSGMQGDGEDSWFDDSLDYDVTPDDSWGPLWERVVKQQLKEADTDD